MKRKILIPFLFLSFLAGCGLNVESDDNQQGHIHTFSEEWSTNETSHWHDSTCGHSGIKSNEGNHIFVNGVCTVCSYVDSSFIPDPVKGNWSNSQKALFEAHLYDFEVPNLEGFSATWDEENKCIYITGVRSSAEYFTGYINSFTELGFIKQNGPYLNSYILLKDVIYEGVTKTIELDAYLSDSMINIICYDPFLYEWPGNIIDILFEEYFYINPQVEIPVVEAEKYYLDTSNMERYASLTIQCYTNENKESSFTSDLTTNGLTVSDARNEQGFFSAEDSKELVDVFFKYFEEEKVFAVIIQKCNSWPAFTVDYYLEQLKASGSDTKIPHVTGATSYEFIEAAYDSHGYFFVLCEMDDSTYETTYAEALDEQYTVYNETVNAAGNYWAISDNQDILVQYKYIVTESIMGGEDYKHFDVLFEKYFPHDEDYINEQLDKIQPGTTTVLPAFPGYGEEVKTSDHNLHLFITIQAATFSSVDEYVRILSDADWDVKEENKLLGQYSAISPNRDLKIETSFQEGRVEIVVSAYKDEYNEWPTDGVNEILETLGLTGEVVPADGAYGYDYENNNQYHDVVCIVKSGTEAEFVENYYQKLVQNGWTKIVDKQNVYYVKLGSNVAVSAYYERLGTGYAYIDIGYGDGTIYDIDLRTQFIEWKNNSEIYSFVNLPGINLTADLVDTQLYIDDEGSVYPGNDLFCILADVGEENVETTITDIKSVFENAGWVYSEFDGFYHNDIFSLNVVAGDEPGCVLIDIFTPIVEHGILSVIKEFIFESGYDFIVLPATINIVDEYQIDIIERDIDFTKLTVDLTFEDAAKASAAIEVIDDSFHSATWTKSTSGSSIIYKDSLDIIKVTIKTGADDNIVTIQLSSTMF